MPRRQPSLIPSAQQSNGSGEQPPSDPPARRRRRNRQKSAEQSPEAFTLENLNPISMGRRSRLIFDDVWTQLQRIGGPSRSIAPEAMPFVLDAPETFESPQAPDTTVLVAGATGRVGRVLVRKLLLRGYKVRALVRRRDPSAPPPEAIPQSVEVVFGDLGDYKSCRAAVEGVDKVICCAAARTTLLADLSRVDEGGVANLARAFQDARNAAARKAGSLAPSSKVDVADFSKEEYHPLWDVEHVGPPESELTKTGYYAKTRRRAVDRARDSAEAYITEADTLVFEGAVYSRDGYAEVGAPLELPHGGSLEGAEGLLLRVMGDGQSYSAVIETVTGATYFAKFTTRLGYSTVRLPFNTFIPGKDVEDGAPFDPAQAARLRIRFEPKTKTLDQVTQAGQSMYDLSGNRFKFELDWIKALPGGVETDFILVSCATGRGRAAALLGSDDDSGARERVVAAKRKGEAVLRNSGLGYTIVRPGPLAEEAGGYRALVFDQGNRIEQSIACADVADVCLKALHDATARNKTFDVCWEYTPEEGLESYELVAHLPDKANNYLSPALATLQRNT